MDDNTGSVFMALDGQLSLAELLDQVVALDDAPRVLGGLQVT